METTLLTLGILLILIGLIGQVKAKEIEVGTNNTFVRIILGVIGVVFVYLALSKSYLTNTPASPTPECRFNNLLNCSTHIAFPEENISAANLIDRKLFLNFRNHQIGSGLAFRFKPPLNVQGFNSLELRSTSTRGFTFLVEYKVKEGDQLKIVTISEHQSFPATAIAMTFPIAITYDGEIDEIVINFFDIGESSELVIDSFRLSNE
jgi:hypothetical protein